MRKKFEWKIKTSVSKCQICGKEFETTSHRQKFCNSPECREYLKQRHTDRQRQARHRKSQFRMEHQ